MRVIFVILVLLQCNPVLAVDFIDVHYVDNYDGDTITVDIVGLPAIFGHHMKVRIRGVDTPELRGGTCYEAAVSAKMFVQELLSSASRIDLVNVQRGKYFRVVADVIVDGHISVGEELLNLELGQRYDGGKKEAWECE